ITVTPALVNTIDTVTQTICSGQSVTVTGQSPSGGGGAGSYTYQWEQSVDNINWTAMTQTSSSITFTPSQSMYVRRKVVSFPCSGASFSAHIIVQAPISNNSITADHSVCINTSATMLQGS